MARKSGDNVRINFPLTRFGLPEGVAGTLLQQRPCVRDGIEVWDVQFTLPSNRTDWLVLSSDMFDDVVTGGVSDTSSRCRRTARKRPSPSPPSSSARRRTRCRR